MLGIGPIVWRRMVRETETARGYKAPRTFAQRPVPRRYVGYHPSVSGRYYVAIDKLTAASNTAPPSNTQEHK